MSEKRKILALTIALVVLTVYILKCHHAAWYLILAAACAMSLIYPIFVHELKKWDKVLAYQQKKLAATKKVHEAQQKVLETSAQMLATQEAYLNLKLKELERLEQTEAALDWEDKIMDKLAGYYFARLDKKGAKFH